MVEGTCLESKRTGNCTEGSNPSLSAIKEKRTPIGVLFSLI